MRLIANIVATILSFVFYPLFVPTYSMALLCYGIHADLVWTVFAVVGTLLLTCLLPMSSIWLMMRRGKVTDMQMARSSERTMPYLYTIIGFAFWCLWIGSMLHAPLFLTLTCVGATVAIVIVMLINMRWKISAHLTGIGGLIGGWISYYVASQTVPSWTIIATWMLFSLVMMFARLRLNAHTNTQVVAGWLLGLCCTCLPYCIIAYVA